MIYNRKRLLVTLAFLAFLEFTSNCVRQIQLDTVIKVQANQLYQTTEIIVSKGEKYQITASGEWQDASFPPSDASRYLRYPNAIRRCGIHPEIGKEISV